MKKIILLFLFLSTPLFSQTNTNRILFEGCTGTWCQYCPCGHQILDGILVNNPQTLVLEYHGNAGSSDPWINFNGNQILGYLGYTAYPRAAIGRRALNLNRAYWVSNFDPQVSIVPPITLSFTNSFNSVTRILTVNATATALRNIDTNTYINLTLTESNLIYNQITSSGCPPGGPNYVHKFVVRNMVNSALGELFSSGSWTQGQTKTKTWENITIDPSWTAANMEIGVFVYMNQSGNPGFTTANYVLQTAKGSFSITSIQNNSEIPREYSLSQNHPNPFNPVTNIKFSIPKSEKVALKIYNALGKEVETVWNDFIEKGEYSVVLNCSNYSSGVYFYKLITPNYTATKKMLVVK